MKIRVLLFWGFIGSLFGYAANGYTGELVGMAMGLTLAGGVSTFEAVVIRDSEIEWRL